MKSIRRSEWSDLVLLLALFLGTFVRFNPTLLAGFPINDGGMFAVMVEDLKDSQYLLPRVTSYNHLDTPYAYPPLGFYLGRIAADLFGLGIIDVMRYVPAFFASLSIPAFYWLALRLLRNKYYAAVSTVFFALMPRALSWFVMGGGLTRSPGQFFMLLTLAVVVRLYEENRRSDILLAGVLGGLAVLSHPEAAVHTSVSAVFLWLMLSRRRATLINAALVGLIVLVVTSPWWATVIGYHGLGPLLNGAQTGQKTAAVFHLVFFAFTEEPYASVAAVLGLIGIGYCLARRQFLLPLWLAIPFFVEGRSAAGPAAIPLAMLAAIGFIEVVLVGIQRITDSGPKAEQTDPLPATERNLFLYLMVYLLFSVYQFGAQLSNATLYPPDQEAMRWVSENTPADARFLVLTGTSSVSCDSVLEWFPAMTGRQSIYTVQGTEWTEGPNFNNYVRSTYDVQECLTQSDVACLDTATERSTYDYVYVSKQLRVNNCAPSKATFPLFLASLDTASDVNILYETEDVVVFERR